LGPFSTVVIDVNIVPPKGVDSTTFPVFSGFVQIDSDAESLHVPYVGLAASLIDKQVLDDTSNFLDIKLPTIMNSDDQVQEGTGNYTFINGDVPTVVYRWVSRRVMNTSSELFAGSCSEPLFFALIW